MNTKNTRWTPSQIKILIENYESKGPKALVPFLNKSMNTISKKARRLGLLRGVSAGNKMRANHWTFTEWSYDLGYIVGVYLGDGNIYIKPNNNAYFRLEVKDKDFCEATALKIERITGYQGSILPVKEKQKSGFWMYRFCNRDFVYWLKDNFGGSKEKQIKLLPSLEANKGMIEGLFDSEGTVNKYCFCIRMSGNLKPIETIFQQLNVNHGPLHKGIREEKWESDLDFKGYSISNKEYTRLGFCSYIKRKAINGICYKEVV